MLKTIIKRNGSREDFQPSKLNKWSQWASEGLRDRVDWSGIVLETVKAFGETANSQELQAQLILNCITRKEWSYGLMAGRLFAATYRKELYDEYIPTIKALHNKLFKAGLMVKLNYSDEEYSQIESIIDHERDFSLAYSQIKYIRGRYALKNSVTKKEYETPQFVFMRMAMQLAESEPIENRINDIKEWYNHFSFNRINPPSPNYTNLGTPLKGFASCCLYTSDDTLESIGIGNHIAYTMTAMSAGIGGTLNVRSVGDPVRNGAIIHQGKMPYYNHIAGAVMANMQAGRGGACTQYYSAFDPENEVIMMAQNPRTPVDKQNRDLHFAMMGNRLLGKKVAKSESIFLFNTFTAPDLTKLFFSGDQDGFEALYNKYEADTSFKKTYIPAREFVIKATTQSFEVGTHYLAFIDEINRHTPYIEPIHSSNLCVAPETLILTDKGYFPIGQLEGQYVNVWNGKQWSNTQVLKTGVDQELIKVVTDSGPEVECTPYHKFYVIDDYGLPAREVRAIDLKPGDKLCKYDLPVIEGTKELDKAYINGFYSGDGCLTRQGQRVYLYNFKRDLMDHFQGGSDWTVQPNSKRLYKHYSDLQDKYFVPGSDYTIKARLEWLAGYLDADGCVYRNGENQQLVCSSIEYEFLKEIQLMLTTLGVFCKIKESTGPGMRQLPLNDGSGEYGSFWCKQSWRLIVPSVETQKLINLGLQHKRLSLKGHTPQRSASQFVKINEVIITGRKDDTYCVNEPLEHKVVFNGILTGNCLEITQPTAPYYDMRDLYKEEDHGRGEVSLCSLGGIVECNIKSDEEYASAAYYTLKMIDYCIHNSDYPLPHVGFTAKQRLNAGVGILGVAVTMAREGYKYDTPEGLKRLHQMAERHAYFCISASLRLGKELGNAPWMHKTKWPSGWLPTDTYKRSVDDLVTPEYRYDWTTLRSEIIANKGIRNSSVIAHMPTESSSKASGVPNCLYPIRDLYLKKTDDSNITEWCAVDSDILGGNYQSAWTIKSTDMIKVYAVWQKFTDQAISADLWKDRSIEINLSKKEMVDEYLAMIKYGMKTRYYQNSLTGSQSKAAITVNATEAAPAPETILEAPVRVRGCSGGVCDI